MTVAYNTETTNANLNKFDILVIRDNSTGAQVTGKLANVSATGKTWANVDIIKADLDDDSGEEWDTAYQTSLIYLKLYSKQNNYIQVGDITLNYLSRF